MYVQFKSNLQGSIKFAIVIVKIKIRQVIEFKLGLIRYLFHLP